MQQTRSSSKSSSSDVSSPRGCFRVFESEFGWFGYLGNERGMTALTFGYESPLDVEKQLGISREDLSKYRDPPADWMLKAEELLLAYCEGEPVNLNSIPRDVSHRSRFEERVREQVMKIGYGETITYGKLAELAGAPRAARAVGTVMSRNPLPLVIPCHRVVTASGKLGGYSAAAGVSMKVRLLRMEQSEVTAGVSGE